jgi:hypothetical protein
MTRFESSFTTGKYFRIDCVLVDSDQVGSFVGLAQMHQLIDVADISVDALNVRKDQTDAHGRNKLSSRTASELSMDCGKL